MKSIRYLPPFPLEQNALAVCTEIVWINFMKREDAINKVGRRFVRGELMGEDLILATMPMIPKCEVDEVLRVIYGSSTRTRGAKGRLVSGFQALTGGKATAYAEEIEKARKEALEDLRDEAGKIGANGVLSIDFETSEILEGFVLVTAYGTAVQLRK